MFRVLLWKELRAGWPLAGAAAAILIVAAVVSVSHDTRWLGHTLFHYGDLLVSVGIVSIGLGIAVGLAQTLPETALGTAAFLAHTAGGRAIVVAAKILSGTLLFLAGALLPLFAGLAYVRSRMTVIEASELLFLWVVAASGFVSYLGVLAVFIRGLPWREGFRQIAGAGTVFAGLLVAFLTPSVGIAAAALAAAGAFASAWAFSGFAVREF